MQVVVSYPIQVQTIDIFSHAQERAFRSLLLHTTLHRQQYFMEENIVQSLKTTKF